jgi:hypothetical protein
VTRWPPLLLPGLSACPPIVSSKIIPCISREDSDWPLRPELAALQGISNADIEGLVSRMRASRDRRPRGHPASGRLDHAFCRSAGTFPSWEAGRRADEPIDPERSHADPGSTSTCAGGRGPPRLLPPRLPALPSPAPPCGDNEYRESVTRPVPRRPSSNLQIRRSGQVVQDRPSMVVGWPDIPELSTCVGCCSAAWLQSWLQSRRNGADPRPSAFQAGHMPSWRGSCGCYALSPVAAGGRWLLLLLLLSPLLSAVCLVPNLRGLPGAVTAPCPPQAPPPNPTAAEPDGRRVLSGGGAADHEAKPRS